MSTVWSDRLRRAIVVWSLSAWLVAALHASPPFAFIIVGTFLAIHFDIHKVLIHEFCDLFIFKRLVLHHVTPVTGRIADTQQDWFVLRFCLCEGLLTPCIPVNRVVRVLKKVRACLINQPVRESVCGHQNSLCYQT